jgi:hypothetical protein
MLSIEKCRSLLGPDNTLSDTQVEQIRQDLYAFATAALESFRHREQCDGKVTQTPPPSLQRTTIPARVIPIVPVADHHTFQERAAILEFEAGLNRQDAERQALLEWAGRSTSRQQAKPRKRLKKSSTNSREPR